MSIFIDQDGLMFRPILRNRLQQAAPSYNQRPFTRKLSSCFTVEQIIKTLGKLADDLISSQQKDNAFILRFLFSNAYKHVSVILAVKINKYTQNYSFTTSCLGFNDHYLKVLSQERIKIICKMINSQPYNSEFTLAVNILNGEVNIKNPVFYSLQLQNLKSLELVLQLRKSRLTRRIQDLGKLLDKVITMSNQDNGCTEAKDKIQLGLENFGKYYWYNRFINAYVYICSDAVQEESYLQNEMKKQSESIQKIKTNYVDFDEDIAPLRIYEHWNPQLTRNEEMHDLRGIVFNKKQIKSKIEMPSMQRSKNPQENGYVLNYIKTKHKLSKYPNKPLCVGGFSKIYVAQVQLWYISSTNVGTNNINEQTEGVEPMRKRIIIKSHCEQKDHPKGIKNRVKHQKFILSRIKNGLAIFLPKYYLLAQTQSPHAKDLLSDFIEYPNLYDYCLKNKNTLSFHTKIYFVIVIVQALRYLAEYRIAHLDLKPTNIMTNWRLNLKLIDFGQSYHPEVQNHEPGFTMPYSAPENYKGCETYNHKNDVFSLGIIMHELFFNQYPFFFHSHDLQSAVYNHGNYLQHWFSCPEGNTMHGDSIVLPLIESIISKCLNPDPNHRPELEWLVFILRGCLEYYY